MLGIRGVPANYGGHETVAEELGARMAERGHRVTVYCRAHNSITSDAVYRGMHRVELPSLRRKHLDTPTHTAVASMHALLHRSDVVHVFGVGNAAWLPLLRFAGRGTVISVDGMDWRRRKWSRPVRMLLERSSLLAIRGSDACITDSREVARYYVSKYGREPHYIAHGVDPRPAMSLASLQALALDDRGYMLVVGRITPEKGVHHLIEAFMSVETAKQLVIVGDGSDSREYWRSLNVLAAGDPRVRLLGHVDGDCVRELFAHAYVYVHPSEVEGTSLALTEAMGYGNCVLVSDIAENIETVGDAGVSFDVRQPVLSLATRLRELVSAPDVVACYREKSLAYARANFSWERVADDHERLYYQAAGVSPPAR